MADLRSIFEALVPENIKNIPLIKTAMDVFLTNLEENAAIALDIKNIYDHDLNGLEPPIIVKSKKELKKSMLNVYLQALYDVISAAQKNQALIKKLELQGNVSTAILKQSAETMLSSGYFAGNKKFKESVGTLASIKYSHNLARMLESNPDTTLPTINESKPFHLDISGPLTSEMYSSIVTPLSHPLGFTYAYNQTIAESLVDLFGLDKIYNINAFQIRNSDFSYIVFSELSGVQSNGYIISGAAYDSVQSSFLSTVNPKTGVNFTIQDFQNQVKIIGNKHVSNIEETILYGSRDVRVEFTDGTFLHQKPTRPGTAIIYNDGTVNFVTPNGVHSTLLLDYNTTLKINYSDSVVPTSWDCSSTFSNDIHPLPTDTMILDQFVSAGVYATDASTYYFTSVEPTTNSGTVFPSNPQISEIFYRTDLAAFYIWDYHNNTWVQDNTITGNINTGVTAPGASYYFAFAK